MVGGDHEQTWWRGYPHYCVTLVRGVDPGEVLTRFGATPGAGEFVDAAEAGQLALEASQQRPVVQVVRHGDWSIAIETASSEGTRREVLRRVSVGGRALMFAHIGDGMSMLGYAEQGADADVFEPLGVERPGSLGRTGLEGLARRLGIGLDELPIGTDGDVSLTLAQRFCGFDLTDDVMQPDGRLCAEILPVLPAPPTTPMGVRTEDDAALSAVLRVAPPDRLAAALSEPVRRLAAYVGLGEHPQLAAGLARAARNERVPVPDESPVGVLLRTMIADGRPPVDPEATEATEATDGDHATVDADHATGMDGETPGRRTVRIRETARVLHAVLTARPELAVGELARRYTGLAWRGDFVADLADVTVPEDVLAAERTRIVPLGRLLGVLTEVRPAPGQRQI